MFIKSEKAMNQSIKRLSRLKELYENIFIITIPVNALIVMKSRTSGKMMITKICTVLVH